VKKITEVVSLLAKFEDGKAERLRRRPQMSYSASQDGVESLDSIPARSWRESRVLFSTAKQVLDWSFSWA